VENNTRASNLMSDPVQTIFNPLIFAIVVKTPRFLSRNQSIVG